MLIKKICCIGADYIGGSVGSVIALKCPQITVHVVDRNEELIMQWNSEKLPVSEADLQPIVEKCRNRNLFFTSNMETPIKEADIIFVCVYTPMKTQGTAAGKTADLKCLEDAARLIAEYAETSKIIVEKSTVPIRAAETIATVLNANKMPNLNFQILSNPEFWTEDTAVQDFLNPERVLIGGENTPQGLSAIENLISIYEHWVPRSNIVTTDTWSSELSKLATSAFLAQRLSSINSLSELCETTNADVSEVALAIGMDSRIGSKFLEPSIGFGGPCFHKGLRNIIYLCECLNLPQVAAYWQKVLNINEHQQRRFTEKIIDAFFNTLTDKHLTILGFAFKKDTKTTTDSPAIYVCKALLEENAALHIYDPAVDKKKILQELGEKDSKGRKAKSVMVFDDPYEAAAGTHGIIICTNWDEFKTLDYYKLYNLMMKPAYIFDGWKILPHKELIDMGFNVQTIGRKLT